MVDVGQKYVVVDLDWSENLTRFFASHLVVGPSLLLTLGAAVEHQQTTCKKFKVGYPKRGGGTFVVGRSHSVHEVRNSARAKTLFVLTKYDRINMLIKYISVFRRIRKYEYYGVFHIL